MLDGFIKKESASGIRLIFTTILALLISHSFLAPIYEYFLHIPVQIRIGPLELDKSLYHWVNDGLTAILVGSFTSGIVGYLILKVCPLQPE